MEREILSSLKLLVNAPGFDNLKEYIRWRREALMRDLTQAEDWDQVRTIQGRLKELDRLSYIKEEVQQKEKEILATKG